MACWSSARGANSLSQQGRALNIPIPIFTRTENDKKATEGLVKIGKELGAPLTSVALAFVMQKEPYVFPIIGSRTVAQLRDNILYVLAHRSIVYFDNNLHIEALKVSLSPEHMAQLDALVPVEKRFPYDLIGTSTNNSLMLNNFASYAWVEDKKAIVPK